MSVSYFAADEAQTLDGIFRNNESAVEGMSDAVSQRLQYHRCSHTFRASSCRLGTRKDWEGSHGSKVRQTLASQISFKSTVASSGINAGIKWRPDASELPEFGPEFKKLWDAYFVNAPDKPVLWLGVLAGCVFTL